MASPWPCVSSAPIRGPRGGSGRFQPRAPRPRALAWQRLWTGSTVGAGGVALSSDGASIYVAGTTFDNGGDALLLKFDATGSLIWQRAWGGIESDSGNAVATGADGSVHVVGTSGNNDGAANLVIVKFDTDGALQWQKAWEGVAGFEAVAVAQDGSVVAAGTRLRPDTGFSEYDVVVVEMSSSGNLLWDRLYSTGEIVDPRGAMAISPDDSIVIAGAIQTPQGGIVGISSLLNKLDANGDLLFDREWGGKNGNAAAGVAGAPDGSIYFAGAGSGSPARVSASSTETRKPSSFMCRPMARRRKPRPGAPPASTAAPEWASVPTARWCWRPRRPRRLRIRCSRLRRK